MAARNRNAINRLQALVAPLVLILVAAWAVAPAVGAALTTEEPFGPQLDNELAPPDNLNPTGDRFSTGDFSPSPSEGRYIVVLKDWVDHPGAVADAQAARHDSEVGFVYRSVLEGYSATLPKDELAALRREPNVKYVTPDIKVEAFSQNTPTGVDRTFDTANEGVAIDEGDNLRVDADVAVLDVGVDHENPDLNVVARTDCVPTYGNPETAECVDGTGAAGHDHGTHVAGTIGALDNGEGVVGIAPGARIWAVKVLNDQGVAVASWIIAGIEWVTGHASQIEVANMSLGGKGESPAMEEAIEASSEAGVVYVVAAGNENSDVKGFFPAGDPDVITVSALADYDGKPGGTAEPLNSKCEKVSKSSNYGLDDTLAKFSNYGEGVDVAAPGVCILSTLPGGEYGYKNGTSMATPHVAGAAAILASEDNPEDLEDVEAIRQTIEEEGNQEWEDTSGDGVQEPLLDLGDETAFTPVDQAAVTGEADVHSTTEVTFNGSVNPHGIETEYYFEYGTTPEYGSKVPASGESAGSGVEYVPVQQTIEVEGQTFYHYRLVAANSEDTFFGGDRTFGTTPPTVISQPATEVSANGATLNATVNPEGFYTTYRFEYGLTPSYGHSLQLSELAAGTEAVEVMSELEGLSAEATYHFRVVATNIAGTSDSEDETFTTEPADWVTQPTPNPHQEEEEEEDVLLKQRGLFKVSCSSPSDCMAIGFTTISHSTRTPPVVRYPHALRWDGKTWTYADLPVPAGVERDKSFMYEVSCSTPASCFALGTDPYVGSGERHLFVDHWDGEHWTTQLMPMPSGGNEGVRPVGISCGSPDSCMAVTEYKVGFLNWPQVIQIWDGKEWSIAPSPTAPEGSDSSTVRAVSCPAANACVAIGAQWAATWDGESWSAKAISFPPEFSLHSVAFDGLSCTAIEACSAVGIGWGIDFSTEELFAGHWDGEEWMVEGMPEPKNYISLTGSDGLLSCSSADDCEFATVAFTEGGQSLLAEHWDGGQWSIQTTVNPEWPFPSVNGVSCVQDHCTMVGGVSVQRLRSSPTTNTDAATEVESTSATLNGVVNPEGFPAEYHFEWSSQAEFEAEGYAHSSADESAGSGTAGIEVSEPLEGLLPGTTYHYRVVAGNSEGAAYSADKTLHTQGAPKATTEAASGVKASQATLNGTVNPEGASTSYYFEYDESSYEGGATHGAKVPASPKSAGSGTSNVAVNEALSGLEPGGTYHFRIVAENEFDTTYGEDESFTTAIDPRFNFAFGQAGSANGQLSSPNGVATDSSGNVWVADTENNRIEKFNEKGEFLAAYGKEGVGNGEFKSPKGIAIDSAGNVWVVDSGNNRVQKLNSKGEYVSKFGKEGNGTGEFKSPAGIAVTGSGPTIYVADTGNDRVQKLNSSGTWQATIGKSGAGNGELKSPQGVALLGSGVWVADTANNRIQKFNVSTLAYVSKFEGTGANQLKSPTAIAPDFQEKLWVVDSGNNRAEKFDTEGNYLDQIGEAGEGPGQLESPTALALPAAQKVLLADTGNSRIESWSVKAEPPTATTGPAQSIGVASASLKGTIDPEGLATNYYFEYGETTSYGTKTSEKSAGSGTSGKAYEELVSGLEFNTTYHFRVIAKGGGYTAEGKDQTFKTLKAPKAATEAATEVKEASAKLNGTVNPEGSATNYYFEWGESESYGHKTEAKSAGSGTSNVAEAEAVASLKAGTTYHFRIVADKGGYTVPGTDKSFTALKKAPKATTEAATEVGATSATLNGTVNPEGNATTYHFEYDTAEYKSVEEGPHGTAIPISAESVGSGTSDIAAKQTPTGLTPGTTYHFRVVAEGAATTRGADKTLTTAGGVITTLCTKDGAACAEADRYPSKTSFTASAESPGVTIANSLGNVTCTESTLAGETSSEAATPLPLKISTWSLGSCSRKKIFSGTETCSTSATAALPESASLGWTEGSTGSLSVASGLQWSIKCGSFIECTLTFSPTATLNGGSPGQITIPETAMTSVSGPFCPETKTFKAASYSVSAPKPAYVKPAAASTTLCKANPEGFYCAEADRYPSKTSFTASAESPGVTIANSLGNVTCTESTLAGETSSEAATPLPLKISTWSLGSCSRKKIFSGTETCSTSATAALPESASLGWTEGSTGSLSVASGLQWSIKCGSFIECTLTFSPTATLNGGSPGQITIPETAMTSVSGPFCPETKTFKAASYSVSAPKPAYVKLRPY